MATISGSEVAPGASGTAVVSLSVPSAVSLTNQCTSRAAREFGTVLPGSPALTATGAQVCRFSWTSSNDTSMLRVGQSDGAGSAMGSVGLTQTLVGPTYDRLEHVSTFDSLLTFAVGPGGIRRTTDGGATWTTANPTTEWLYEIDHEPGNANVWMAAGNNGVLLRTTDGQAAIPTWTSAPAAALAVAGWPATVHVTGLDVVDANVAFIAGGNGWMAKTVDAGATFTVFQHPGNPYFTSISAVDANTAYTVSCQGALMTTTGGASAGAWTSVPGAGRCWNDVFAADSTHVYMAGFVEEIGFWDGTTYRQNSLPTRDVLYGVRSSAATPGVAVAVGHAGTILRSVDSGMSWTRIASATNQDLTSLDITAGGIASIGGSAHLTLRSIDGGATWSKLYEAPGQPTHHGSTVAEGDGQLMLLAGSTGSIRRSTDGGTSWVSSATGSVESLFAVDLGTTTHGWAVGDNGVVLRTTDGGVSWNTQTSGTTARLRAVHAVDAWSAYAVGEGGAAIRTVNGGTSWQVLATGTTAELLGVDAPSVGNVWISGPGAFVRVSTDGGASFVAPTTRPNVWATLGAVDAVDGAVAYVAAGFRAVWKTTDGGVTWGLISIPAALGTDLDVRTLAALDEDRIVAGGKNQNHILRTIDGGATWTVQPLPWPYGQYHTFAASDANTVIAAGANGSVSRAEPAAPAGQLVSDYGAGASWGSASSTNMFGICLQAVDSLTTTVNSPTWNVDTFNSAGECEALDSDPWRAVPNSMSKVGSAALGATGRADVVFGFRPKASQQPGVYSARVTFEVIAPAV